MEIKIKLKIKDVEIELTEKEAKELKEILNEIYPEKEIKVIKEKEYIPYPYYPPIIINPEPYKWDQWEVTWDNDITGQPLLELPVTISYSGK